MDGDHYPTAWRGIENGRCMVKRIFPAFNAVIAISVGVLVLLGYFIDLPPLSGYRSVLLGWSVILAGVAVLVGIWNLFSVHLQKIRLRQKGFINSLVLLVFLLLTAILSLTPDLKPMQGLMLNGILVPVEISLMAVLSISLILSSMRLLQVRSNLATILFLVSVVLIMLGSGPFPFIGQLPLVSDWLRPFISDTLATSGARGILIGVALGTLTTGLRILFGVDRPYGGK